MIRTRILRRLLVAAAWIGAALAAVDACADIGQIKTARGDVTVLRGERQLPGVVGLRLEAADTIRTGTDGSVGITMRDNSLLALGPNTVVALELFEFDPATNEGRFESWLRRGDLAVSSGRLAKQSPRAMTVRTPSAVLGVRGTDFVVSTEP